MSAAHQAEFALTMGLHADHAVLGVMGEVDLLTAPTLGAVLDVLVEQGHDSVVLDLAGLAFTDASGLQVIADAAARLDESSGVLTLRTVPALTRRILELTGVSELVHIEASAPEDDELGREQRADDHSLAVASPPPTLSSDLARVGSVPAGAAVIEAALRLVATLATMTVEGADGVSVILERHGQLTTVASSDETIRRMDEQQYLTGEGPCLSAASEGRWFHIESLDHEDRWPAFVSGVRKEGIASILSTPLMMADRSRGALNMYSHSERAFGAAQQELAALFATQASAILADGDVDVSDERQERRISDALVARTTIAQAQGVLMAQQHLAPRQAAAVLHRSARDDAVTVLHQAVAILSATRVDADRGTVAP